MHYRTLAQELIRRAGIEAQMKQLLDNAKESPDLVGNFMRAMLYAELFRNNEESKQPFDNAMGGLVQALEWRASSTGYRTEVQHG